MAARKEKKLIQIKVGDVLDIREPNENEKSKFQINTYQVESIPSHKRFIVCRMLKDDKKTVVKKCFTKLDLREGVVWGGTKA